MTKQEFLAMSLPYGLKVKFITERIQGYSATKHEAEFDNDFEVIKSIPILRPLPDLTKEIEHNGEKFVPIERLWSIVYPNCKANGPFDNFKTSNAIVCHSLQYGYDSHFYINDITANNFWKVQKLVEWHFDICGLIEKVEAIDVNTLEINPYK